MKAVSYNRYGAPEVLQLVDVPKPSISDTQILVKIIATSVTQVDTAFRSGSALLTRLFTGMFRPKKPILGTELAGIIVATGAKVSRFQVGEKVFGAAPGGVGAHAQFIAMSEHAAIVTLPKEMSFEEGAVVNNGALTALPFLRDCANLRAGQTILIIGASGSIGSYAVQLAAQMGAHVTGCCSSANLEMVRDLGAANLIDYTKTDFTKCQTRYDVIFDTVGKTSFQKARGNLERDGVFITATPDPTILCAPILRLFGGGQRAKMSATGMRKDALKIVDMDALKQMFKAGTLVAVIDRSYPLEAIQTAHEYVEAGHKRGNLVVLVPH